MTSIRQTIDEKFKEEQQEILASIFKIMGITANKKDSYIDRPELEKKREEIEALLEFTVKENIIIIQLNKDGCDFAQDSRVYISEGEVGMTWITDNNGTKEYLYKQLDRIIEEST